MLKAKYFILLICFSFLLKTEAKVTLTSIWGDNMVLQQQSEVTFSGTATSGKRVQATASWNNKKIQTNVDAKGEWKLWHPDRLDFWITGKKTEYPER